MNRYSILNLLHKPHFTFLAQSCPKFSIVRIECKQQLQNEKHKKWSQTNMSQGFPSDGKS